MSCSLNSSVGREDPDLGQAFAVHQQGDAAPRRVHGDDAGEALGQRAERLGGAGDHVLFLRWCGVLVRGRRGGNRRRPSESTN
jgi:hypothetical protein